MVAPEVAEQVRNVAAVVTSALDDAPIWRVVYDGLVDDMRAADHASLYGVFAGLVVGLLDQLAAATGRPREELWQEIAAHLVTRVSE